MKTNNLTTGNIPKELLFLSIPLIISSLVSIFYNITDMFFIGRVGPEALSAVGIAGLYIWLASSVVFFSKQGMEILISHAVGRRDHISLQQSVVNGILLNFFISFIYSIFILIFTNFLIDIYGFNSGEISAFAKEYLRISSFSILFMMLNMNIMSIFQGTGNTIKVLLFSGFGLIVNIILDPIFIFYFDLEVAGAAYATLIANFLVFLISFLTIAFKTDYLKNFKSHLNWQTSKDILKLSLPSGSYQVFFTMTAMFISQFSLSYGDEVAGAQRIGTQIESFSWMIGIGLSIAIGVFVGQNYTSQKYKRILNAFVYMFIFVMIYGVSFSLFMFFRGEFIINIFSKDPGIVSIGIPYLKIVAFSQVFMLIEGICGGFFNGFGKTKYASFFSISGNIIRIILVFVFSYFAGLNGIWWAISLSSIYKGSGLLIALIIFIKKDVNFQQVLFKQKV